MLLIPLFVRFVTNALSGLYRHGMIDAMRSAGTRLRTMLNSIVGYKVNLARFGGGLVVACCIPLVACGSIAEKTNGLSDERILSEAGGTLGIAPSDLTMESRRVEGVNTYVTLKGKDGKTYACTINGGNLFSFGMTNPPVCNAR